GVTFRYPKGWSARLQDDLSVLLLPDQQGKEAFGFIPVASGNITSVEDQHMIAQLDAHVQKLSPTAQRIGIERGLRTGFGPGILIKYEGQTPQGEQVALDAYVTLSPSKY